MFSQVALVLSILLIVFSGLAFGQKNQLPTYEDETAYEVYSAVLLLPQGRGSQVSKTYLIRSETLRNFGAFIDTDTRGPAEICLRPDPEWDTKFRPVIDDFMKVNKIKWRLENKFKLHIPYQLVSSEKVIPLIQKDGWSAFHKKYPGSGGFVDLSAVGFNADKTIAIVSKGGWCGDLCGEGSYYVLEKVDGKWTRLDWKGDTCSWVS